MLALDAPSKDEGWKAFAVEEACRVLVVLCRCSLGWGAISPRFGK